MPQQKPDRFLIVCRAYPKLRGAFICSETSYGTSVAHMRALLWYGCCSDRGGCLCRHPGVYSFLLTWPPFPSVTAGSASLYLLTVYGLVCRSFQVSCIQTIKRWPAQCHMSDLDLERNTERAKKKKVKGVNGGRDWSCKHQLKSFANILCPFAGVCQTEAMQQLDFKPGLKGYFLYQCLYIRSKTVQQA